jgi:WD40 repeat protein
MAWFKLCTCWLGLLVVGGSTDVAAAQHIAAAPGMPGPGLDAWGDALPAGAIQRLGSQRQRHGGMIGAIAWSADGKWLASGGGFTDRTVRLWDAATGKQLREFKGHGSNVVVLAVAPDGQLAASVDISGQLCVWQTADAKLLHATFLGDHSGVFFAADSKSLLTIQNGRPCLVDTKTWALTSALPATLFQQPIEFIACSSDGKTLAAAQEGNAYVVDVDKGMVRHTLAHKRPISGLSLSRDGQNLAVANGDRIDLWHTVTGKPIRVADGRTSMIRSLCWSPDGATLAVGGQDWTVHLWDIGGGRELLKFTGHRAPVTSVAFSPDGKRIASGGDNNDPTLRIWDLATGKENPPLEEPFGWIGGLALLASNQLMVVDSYGSIGLWDATSWKRTEHFSGQQSRGKAFAIARDGKVLATGTADGTVRLQELPKGKEFLQFKAHGDAVHTLAFSPDDRWIITHGKDNLTLVWDATTGKKSRVLSHHSELIYWFAFSSDGKTMYAADKAGSIGLWDIDTWKLTGRLAAHKSVIEQARVSPDGGLLASGSWDSTARVWDLASGKEIRTLTPAGSCQCLAFSPDGRTIATGSMDRKIRLWELSTGKLRGVLEGHRGAVAGLLFLPDGQTLVSGSSDGTALVWDLSGRRSGQLAAAKALSDEALEAEWQHLHGADVARSYRALWALAASPEQALRLLQKELQQARQVDAKVVDRWIADLDAPNYAVRQKAFAELKKAGDVTWAALGHMLNKQPTLEMRARILMLLGKMGDPVPVPERLGLLHKLELLEQLRTPEARQFLQTLAGGAPEAWLTAEAKRMQQRATPRE